MTNTYTLDEVASHNDGKDLWIVINNVIYNITEFHKEHPGGEEILLQFGGQDATECFESIGHSQEAINLREKFKIGQLLGSVSSNKSKPAADDISSGKTTDTEVKESVKTDFLYQEQEFEAGEQTWRLKFICTVIVIYALIFFYWL